MALPDWMMRLTIFASSMIDLGEPAIAAEDEGVAAVARIDGGGVGKIAEAADAGVGLTCRGVDQRDVAAGPFDNQAEIAGAAQLRAGAGC